MKLLAFIVASCALFPAGWAVSADSRVGLDAYAMRYMTARCADVSCWQVRAISGPGRFWKTSEKSRAIARRLDASGYYSEYSEAMKGYPSLRSKKPAKSQNRALALNAENRKRYRPHVNKIARKYRLDPNLLDAVIVVESGYNPKAVSLKGASGLMQLMPDTAERFGVSDPFNPVANMHGGARYLRWLMDRFENDLELTLAAYNAGEGALARNGNTVPPFKETRTYVDRVLAVYETSGTKHH